VWLPAVQYQGIEIDQSLTQKSNNPTGNSLKWICDHQDNALKDLFDSQIDSIGQ
jgi:hypothetical protein